MKITTVNIDKQQKFPRLLQLIDADGTDTGIMLALKRNGKFFVGTPLLIRDTSDGWEMGETYNALSWKYFQEYNGQVTLSNE